MNSNRNRIANDTRYPNLDSVQMSSADRDAAKRHLRAADAIATTLANGIALLTGFVSGRSGINNRSN